MEQPERNIQRGHDHGSLPMLISCGFMLIALVVLSSLGASWGFPLILLALILCPLMMLLLMRAAADDRQGTPWKEGGHEQNT
jgi:hypothetical protein